MAKFCSTVDRLASNANLHVATSSDRPSALVHIWLHCKASIEHNRIEYLQVTVAKLQTT